MSLYEKYHAPTTIDGVLELLAQYGERARIIAGGTDLLIELERKIRDLDAVIDVTRIAGLDEITLDEDGWIHLGPLVTHNQCANSELILDRGFPLAQACWEVGAPQIRNRATIAGNLITASPANDTITPLVAMGAQVTVRSVKHGDRTMSLEAFNVGFREVDLKPAEMLVDIAFPAMEANTCGAFAKLGLRRAQAISVVDMAVILIGDADAAQGVQPPIRSARIALGSVAPKIIRAPDAEEALAGSDLSDAEIERIAELTAEAATPISDVRGTADYRNESVRVFTRRLLRALRDGTERDEYPQKRANLWPAPAHPVSPIEEPPGEGVIRPRVNGQVMRLEGAGGKTLLRALRENAGLIGTKEGCAEGECGACTVILDGAAVMSCMVPAERAHDANIITIEGLADGDTLHPVQQAFVEHDAVQCGYCTPGFIMSAAKLLEENPEPTVEEIRQAISGNLCRCTGYYKIIEAIRAAAHDVQSEEHKPQSTMA